MVDYNDKAKTKIEEYYTQTKGGTVLLDDAQKIDLAMWLAVYANSSKKGVGKSLLDDTNIPNTNVDFSKFAKNVGIDLSNMMDPSFTIIVNNKPKSWKRNGCEIGYDIGGDPKARVLNIRKNIFPAFE